MEEVMRRSPRALTAVTSWECPLRVRRHLPEKISQMRTLLSLAHVTAQSPLPKQTPRRKPWCPRSVDRARPVPTCQTMPVVSRLPVITRCPRSWMATHSTEPRCPFKLFEHFPRFSDRALHGASAPPLAGRPRAEARRSVSEGLRSRSSETDPGGAGGAPAAGGGAFRGGAGAGGAAAALASQKMALRSCDPVARRRPSAEMATAQTRPRWPPRSQNDVSQRLSTKPWFEIAEYQRSSSDGRRRCPPLDRRSSIGTAARSAGRGADRGAGRGQRTKESARPAGSPVRRPRAANRGRGSGRGQPVGAGREARRGREAVLRLGDGDLRGFSKAAWRPACQRRA